MHTKSLRDADAAATRASVAIVAEVTPSDLHRPTPCAEWDLATLLSHMIAQHRGFAAAADGKGADLTVWQPLPLPADPVDGYASAARAVIEAFTPEDVPGRPFLLPEFRTDEPFPGSQAMAFHFIDYVVHAWDVAQTIGVPYDPPAELLALALPIARAVPQGGARLAPGAAFGPATPVPPGSDPLTEILSLLGRRPY
jgi:uncharacterized protein (TIGR03086 family)